MNALGSLLTWLALDGYWFVLAGLVAAFCIRDTQKRRSVVGILLIFGGIMVGSIFLAAAYGKLKPLPGFAWSWRSARISISMFAIQVESYQILSPGAANLVAHLLPFFEIFLGLWLASGIGRRFSSILAALVLSVFMIAISYAYHKGLKIDCGCGIGPPEEAGPAALLRDGLKFLLPTLILLAGSFWIRHRPGAESVSGARAATEAESAQ
ncbi:MAG: MauE/DoxX family redox-associated membrane protein [Candidatus Acidiferrales bacterium]